MLYRIFTEDKGPTHVADVERVVSQFFPGFTIVKADGYWRLQKEHSIIIEITDPTVTRQRIDELLGRENR